MSHTKEPWIAERFASKTFYFRFLSADGRPVAGTAGGGHENPLTADEIEANARRIVACVNACSGLLTEDLERYYNTGGGLDEAMEEASLRAHVSAVRQRDELLEAMYRIEEDLIVGKSDDLTLAGFIRDAIISVTGGAQ